MLKNLFPVGWVNSKNLTNIAIGKSQILVEVRNRQKQRCTSDKPEQKKM
ncbi:hypothetical protein [Okeania sp. SIO1I7]|nr:hypothetical protein [Okeania sp. SIO1I7]NET26619.1 hypothetical protein [Okeania sp. SIO1I7]